MDISIEIEGIDRIRELIEQHLLSSATPMELLALDDWYSADAVLAKAIRTVANETIARLSSNLHPGEAEIIKTVMELWKTHEQEIVEQVAGALTHGDQEL